MLIALRRARTLLVALSLTGVGLSSAGASAAAPEDASVRCSTFTTVQSRYEHRFAAPMMTWSRTELSDLRGRSVLYLFSGPDVVTALSLFPDAPHVTLVADQVPEYDLVAQSEPAAPGAAERECKMLSFFAQLGYYRTLDLNGQGGSRPRFLQLLRYSIAFSGAAITSTSILAINPAGIAEPIGPGSDRKPQGVRFEARRQDGRAVTVDYLTIDLSNRGLRADGAGTALLHRNASDVVFLKSASHLLQHRSFSDLASLLTSPAAPFVVQDETGLPVELLEKNYNLTLYGHYTAPQSLWAHDAGAKAFVDLFAHHDIKGTLPYVYGYEKRSGSAVVVGRRR
jgi:hypothetical protein